MLRRIAPPTLEPLRSPMNSPTHFPVCVFCASSNDAPEHYFDAARRTGAELARRGWPLVYGGGSVGLMGACARATHTDGGRVIGVIPENLRKAEVAYEDSDELIVTKDMAERKDHLIGRASAFINLPGGFGTLDEMLEVITLKILGYHDKPILIVNVGNCYDELVAAFERIYADKMARPKYSELYELVADVDSAFARLDEVAQGVSR